MKRSIKREGKITEKNYTRANYGLLEFFAVSEIIV